jgi:hypothetical protein
MLLPVIEFYWWLYQISSALSPNMPLYYAVFDARSASTLGRHFILCFVYAIRSGICTVNDTQIESSDCWCPVMFSFFTGRLLVYIRSSTRFIDDAKHIYMTYIWIDDYNFMNLVNSETERRNLLREQQMLINWLHPWCLFCAIVIIK